MSPVWILIFHIAFRIVLGAEKCLVPVLENGRARQKGKFARYVRYNCRRDFQLLGSKYAHCIRGSWDSEKPVCIRAGCKWNRPEYLNGLFLDSYRGALVKVVCNPGYAPPGPSTTYCNGQKWNGTFPSCLPIEINPKKNCDFGDGLCGWMNGPENNGMNWQRIKSNANHPAAYSDYFIQSPENNGKNTSRLYSPVFSIGDMTSSSGHCFFYSFLMNKTAGTLKIFVLLEGETLDETIPDVWIYGDQGPIWKKSNFALHAERNFQIILEGSGDGVSLDDLRIASLEECYAISTDTESTPSSTSGSFTSTDAFDTADDFSCQGRCMEAAVLVGTDITADQLNETDKCDCSVTCIRRRTCCNDFMEYCAISTLRDFEQITEEIPYQTSTSTEESNYEASSASTEKLKQDITYSNGNLESETPLTSSHRVKHTTISTSQTRIMNTTALPTTVSATTNRTTYSRHSVLISTTFATKKSQLQITTFKPNTKSKKSKMDNSNNKGIQPVQNKSYKNASDPRRTWSNGNTIQQAIMSKEKDALHVKIPLRVIVEAAAGCAVVLLISTVLVVFLKRHMQKRYQNSLVEDSDVRFLTSDEDLDFSLASPTDSEL